MAYGLHSNCPMIDVSTEAAFWAEVERKTPASSGRRLRKDIQKSVDSIQHKLNIIRYNAGLIHNMTEKDYLRLAYRHLYSNIELASIDSITMYQDRCMFLMQNDSEYRMFLTLFIESFAAASFSLFEVCAYLLKDIYSLPFLTNTGKSIRVSYKNALGELNRQAKSPALYSFLLKYKANETNNIKWIDPLEEMRHLTTHRPITDVCRLPTQSKDGNLYYDKPTVREFLLDNAIFKGITTDEKLKAFVEECFDGIEHFVEELYAQLTTEIQASPSLPL
jgi:hypothetical protein